jgi:sigma-B regulation protein RsbU (phosphoserine phosphatase)
MADVSGKGIPAALFMMMSKIMVQNFALTLGGPGEVLQKVNDQICTNQVEEMFVTVWLGFLDLRTGLLTAANAGHEYPILMAPGGEFELLKDKHGLVVGGMEGYPYQEYQLKLEAGSRLFLYTDGLPEAIDTENRMFGIERTLKSLNEVKNGTPREVLDHVTKSVADFVGSAPQFDDTTMLCLDYRGC